MNEISNTGVIEPAAHRQPVAPVQQKRGVRAWFAQTWPSALVLTLLVAVGSWGHATGWKIPKFADLFGAADKSEEDWCTQHGLPHSICVECDDKLMARVKDHKYCKKHFVHNCPFEHADVIQMEAPVYQVTPEDLARFKRAWNVKERVKNNPKWLRYQRRVQIASQEAFDKMVIGIARVEPRAMTESIRVSGEICYEQPSIAPQNVPVSGRVLRVTSKGQLGTSVNEGDLLAIVESAEVGKVKAELTQAALQLDQRRKYLENIRSLVPTSISEARFREAEAGARESQIQLAAARQALLTFGIDVQADHYEGLLPDEIGKRLQHLGLSAKELKELNLRTPSAGLLPVRASSAGLVTEARATPGKGVDPATPLFVVADNRKMWLMLNVNAEDEKYVRLQNVGKDNVFFTPDGSTRVVAGQLIGKSSALDKVTRTVQFRAVVANADGKLLAETFGTGDIVLRREDSTIAVPNSALHWDGEAHFVFVMDKNFSTPGAFKVFHVRSVLLGMRDATHTEILAGLVPGEWVATVNSTLLRAELLKGDMGDG